MTKLFCTSIWVLLSKKCPQVCWCEENIPVKQKDFGEYHCVEKTICASKLNTFWSTIIKRYCEGHFRIVQVLFRLSGSYGTAKWWWHVQLNKTEFTARLEETMKERNGNEMLSWEGPDYPTTAIQFRPPLAGYVVVAKLNETKAIS